MSYQSENTAARVREPRPGAGLPAPSSAFIVRRPIARNANQQALDLDSVTPADQEEAIQERFERFHADNPHVYRELVMLARRAKQRGAARIGIGMLFEVLRWRHTLRTGGEDGFKLNNVFRSRYARLIMEQEPDLDGAFETRKLHAR